MQMVWMETQLYINNRAVWGVRNEYVRTILYKVSNVKNTLTFLTQNEVE